MRGEWVNDEWNVRYEGHITIVPPEPVVWGDSKWEVSYLDLLQDMEVA